MKLVIGWGNPLRGDDAIGLEVVRLLEEQTRNNSKAVKFIAAHQLLPEMSEEISGADHVFFVDADRSLAPGTVQCLELALYTGAGAVAAPAISGDNIPSQSMSHHLTPQLLLDYAVYLYGKAPAATVTAVGGAKFDYGALTEGALSGVMEACRIIERRL